MEKKRVIVMKATPEEYVKLEKKAASECRTVANYVRACALKTLDA